MVKRSSYRRKEYNKRERVYDDVRIYQMDRMDGYGLFFLCMTTLLNYFTTNKFWLLRFETTEDIRLPLRGFLGDESGQQLNQFFSRFLITRNNDNET